MGAIFSSVASCLSLSHSLGAKLNFGENRILVISHQEFITLGGLVIGLGSSNYCRTATASSNSIFIITVIGRRKKGIDN